MALARNSLYNIAGNALPMIVGIVAVPIYIHLIGAERYGALSIAFLLLGYFGSVDFGVGRAVTQRLAARREASSEEKAIIVWSGAVVVLASGLLGALLTYSLGAWFFSSAFKVDQQLQSELLNSLWLLAICNPIMALCGFSAGALRGVERFSLVAVSNFAGMTALQVFPIAVAATFSQRLDHLIAAAVVARALTFVMQAAGAWRVLLRRQPIRISKAEVSVLAHFGKWVLVSSLLGPLMLSTDRFVIGAILGAVAVAAYTVSFQLSYRLTLFPAAIVETMFPRMAQAGDAEAKVLCTQYSNTIGPMFAPFIVGLICIWEPLLKLWLGSALDPRSVLIGQILLVGIWGNGLANVPYSYLQARGHTRFTGSLHIIELPFYAATLALLGWKFGLPGVAAAFSIRCLADALILFWRARLPVRSLLAGLGPSMALIGLAVFLHPWMTGFAVPLVVGTLLGVIALAHGFRALPEEYRRKIGARFPVFASLGKADDQKPAR